ncbi:MAG: hypothetical protein NWR72_16270, partial [Bacteroidia bacterium]|nr:hypothetical protein [Bacteroidia bacterium]
MKSPSPDFLKTRIQALAPAPSGRLILEAFKLLGSRWGYLFLYAWASGFLTILIGFGLFHGIRFMVTYVQQDGATALPNTMLILLGVLSLGILHYFVSNFHAGVYTYLHKHQTQPQRTSVFDFLWGFRRHIYFPVVQFVQTLFGLGLVFIFGLIQFWAMGTDKFDNLPQFIQDLALTYPSNLLVLFPSILSDLPLIVVPILLYLILTSLAMPLAAIYQVTAWQAMVSSFKIMIRKWKTGLAIWGLLLAFHLSFALLLRYSLFELSDLPYLLRGAGILFLLSLYAALPKTLFFTAILQLIGPEKTLEELIE